LYLSIPSSIILEAMLTYASYSNLLQASTPARGYTVNQASELTDSNADTMRFFLQMSADISMLATHIGRPLYRNAVPGNLGVALTASPADRARAWRRLYVQTSCLLARCTADAPAGPLRGELIEAFARLEQFVCENADLVRS
jgi:hypothetical protein